MHYLDNSATTPLCDAAVKSISEYCENRFANPSSLYSIGNRAREIMEADRADVASAIGCKSDEVYFTSCGSEANNTAVFGAAKAKRHEGRHIITTAVEHPSVLNAVKQLENDGYDVTYLQPDADGVITAEQIENALRRDTVLISVMKVNNETGAIMPVEQIKPVLKKHGCGALVHSDCVQAFGKIDITPKMLGADLVTVSGHKIHAPKGIGALYVANGVRISPLIFGGGQEKGLRSGTESTLLIHAFAAAARDIGDMGANLDAVRELRDYTAARLKKIDGVTINNGENTLPYILNFSLVGLPSQPMMNFLSAKDIFVSGGSACAKGRRSHVLAAQGLDTKVIDSAVRVSFSRMSTADDAGALCDAVEECAATLIRRR